MEENTESLYPEGAVTGSAEDVLQGRDVEIRNSNAEKIESQNPTEEASQTEKTEEAEQKSEEQTKTEKTDEDTNKEQEESIEERVSKAVEADQTLQDELGKKGIDFDALADEYYADGDLSEKSYEQLEKAGYPKSVINAYITGLEATAKQFVADVYQHAGGQEEYEKIAGFISKQNDGSAERFNALIEKGDMSGIRLALDGFKARMHAANGYTGRSILGRSSNAGNNAGNMGFANRGEMVKAMSDPRYLRDPSYTKEVQDKTMNSSFIG